MDSTPGSAAVDALPWHGLKILEFCSGAAGPITSRYFIEQGATVIKVESTQRPDFLRAMAARGEHSVEGSTLFDSLNVAKQSVTLNLKTDQGKTIAHKLFQWADVVIENFAPGAMKRHGLDYDTMVDQKPDLIMLSTCLNGQTGPHKDYPGFGGQGSALCGFNYLTGWPEREPIGPFGTITDSLSPRFAAVALAAALRFRHHTGNGLYLDLSQVETGAYGLSPWLFEHSVMGHCHGRLGNHDERAVPHGIFPCEGEDRWIAIACWSDETWSTLEKQMGWDANLDSLEQRLANRQTIESRLADWCSGQSAQDIANTLQSLGVEAVPVADFVDLFAGDEQLRARGHFVTLSRLITGDSNYERNGYRLECDTGGYTSATPLLGEHTESVLIERLGYSPEESKRLLASGALD